MIYKRKKKVQQMLIGATTFKFMHCKRRNFFVELNEKSAPDFES